MAYFMAYLWLTFYEAMTYIWLTFYLPMAFRAHARFPVVLRGSLELSAVQPSTVVAARRAQLKPGTTAAARRGEHGAQRPRPHHRAAEVPHRRRAVGGALPQVGDPEREGLPAQAHSSSLRDRPDVRQDMLGEESHRC